MYANRSKMARTSGEATNIRFRSAEGIYKAKAKLVDRIRHLVPRRLGQTGGNPPSLPDSNVGFYPLGFDSDSPVSTDLFAYICTYLRTFALKTFFFPSRDVLGSHRSE